MSLIVRLPPPAAGTTGRLTITSLQAKPARVGHLRPPILPKIRTARSNRKLHLTVRAAEESQEQTAAETESDAEAEMSEIGAEIKKVMREKRKAEGEREGELSVSGVAREVAEIEWPAFGKVLGTTGVVLGVIAGSSVVLLTVNFLLAELSDRVFAGRGFQDFLG